MTGRMDLGAANFALALAIATTKATLVVLFFMHLSTRAGVNRLVFVVSLLFVVVMMLGVFGDLWTRAAHVAAQRRPDAHQDPRRRHARRGPGGPGPPAPSHREARRRVNCARAAAPGDVCRAYPGVHEPVVVWGWPCAGAARGPGSRTPTTRPHYNLAVQYKREGKLPAAVAEGEKAIACARTTRPPT